MNATVVVCQEREADCRCREELNHEGPHICECSGSWDYDADGRFFAVTLPDPYWREREALR